MLLKTIILNPKYYKNYKPWQLIFACDGPSILNPKAPVSPQVSTVNLAGLLTMPLFNPGP